MDFSGITAKTWTFTTSTGHDWEQCRVMVTVDGQGLCWESQVGAPHWGYEPDQTVRQSLPDFILNGPADGFLALKNHRHKNLLAELRRHIAVAQQTSGQLNAAWDDGVRFIHLATTNVVAGCHQAAFPGGDMATAWPIHGFTPAKARQALELWDDETIEAVLLTISLLAWL